MSCLLLVAWFWLASLRTRDIAVAAARCAVQQYRLQLLDATVAFHRMKPVRDAHGKLRLQRTYTFEVSDTGNNRLPCSITLVGNQVSAIEIPPYRDPDGFS